MTPFDAVGWCVSEGASALTSPHAYVLVCHPNGLVSKGTTLTEAVMEHQSGRAGAPTAQVLDVIAQTLTGQRKEFAVTVAGFNPGAPAPPPVDPVGGLDDGAIGDGA